MSVCLYRLGRHRGYPYRYVLYRALTYWEVQIWLESRLHRLKRNGKLWIEREGQRAMKPLPGPHRRKE